MEPDIVQSQNMLESIQEELESFEIPYYKFHRLYSKKKKVFFNCQNNGTIQCLNANLKREDHDYFIVFLLVKNIGSDKPFVMDVRFPNISRESLEHFIDRYNSQLKSSNIMNLEASGKTLIRYLGYSYEN